ncbi:hypothetical protein GCM10009863_59560 [Streptomyces axinellae]|uniref:Uncharacterized protein n=1 Tax=Streptomyces axinellae TaxID=552788 RepID=A0ABP6D458_9ACTN
MIQESGTGAGTGTVHAGGTSRSQPVMTWTRLLETVRYDGAYPTRERPNGSPSTCWRRWGVS